LRAILSGPAHFADKRNIKKAFSTLYRECNIGQTVLLMKRKDYSQNPVEHIKINGALTVDELVHQFQGSGSFGAGRLARACNAKVIMLNLCFDGIGWSPVV
jgi:hypothetical protein